MKKNFKSKRSLAMMLCFAMSVTMCSCQRTPQESIVKEKDFDKMIEDAKQDSGNRQEVSSMKYDTYTVDINDENLKVKVSGEAQVDIPQTDKLSIMKVRQKDISQDTLDRLIKIAAPGEELYDSSVMTMNTKENIEKEIQGFKKQIMEIKKEIEGGGMTEEDGQTDIDACQSEINRLQEMYENAPEGIQWDSYISDKKIKPVKDLHNSHTENEFYDWLYELNEGGTGCYVINDGKSGDYISISVQNNEDYGNCLRYRKCKNGYIATYTVAVGMGDGSLEMWDASEGTAHTLSHLGEVSIEDCVEYTNEPTTISSEEARRQADEFIKNMELDEYGFYQSQLCYEIPDIRLYPDGSKEGDMGYRRLYVLTYLRSVDGVLVNNIAEDKNTIGWSNSEYVKRFWPGEMLAVYVNDAGVVGMDLNAPVEITETVVDKASLKEFDEIKGIFEQMVVIGNAREYEEIEINIERVTLGYTRISAKDNFAEGYLIPYGILEAGLSLKML